MIFVLIGQFLYYFTIVSATNKYQCNTNDYYGNFNPNSFADKFDLKEAVHDLIDEQDIIPYFNVDEIQQVLDGDGTGAVFGIYSFQRFTSFPNQWNKEHLWPRSRGVGDTGADTSDLYHLYPASSSLNSARSNKYFDECSTFSSSCQTPASTATIVGAAGSSEDSFTWAPPLAVRGNIARAIFYMAVRYDGSDPDTTQLLIKECSTFSTCGDNTFGRLSTLIKWHEDDPVDDNERNRVNQICQNYQGNRNPFVDYPQLVQMLSETFSQSSNSNGFADFGNFSAGDFSFEDSPLLPFILICCFMVCCFACPKGNTQGPNMGSNSNTNGSNPYQSSGVGGPVGTSNSSPFAYFQKLQGMVPTKYHNVIPFFPNSGQTAQQGHTAQQGQSNNSKPETHNQTPQHSNGNGWNYQGSQQQQPTQQQNPTYSYNNNQPQPQQTPNAAPWVSATPVTQSHNYPEAHPYTAQSQNQPQGQWQQNNSNTQQQQSSQNNNSTAGPGQWNYQ